VLNLRLGCGFFTSVNYKKKDLLCWSMLKNNQFGKTNLDEKKKHFIFFLLSLALLRHHDAQNNDIQHNNFQHNDTQHNNNKSDTQHNTKKRHTT
jgi:hypothetical protein